MKVIKANHLFDGVNEIKETVFLGFDENKIQYVGSVKPKGEIEVIAEGKDIVITPAFIDSHSHIGLQRSAEYSGQYEENEQMDPVNPLTNALHSRSLALLIKNSYMISGCSLICSLIVFI